MFLLVNPCSHRSRFAWHVRGVTFFRKILRGDIYTQVTSGDAPFFGFGDRSDFNLGMCKKFFVYRIERFIQYFVFPILLRVERTRFQM